MKPFIVPLLASLAACSGGSASDSASDGAVGSDGTAAAALFDDCPADAPDIGSVQLSNVRLDVACQGVASADKPTILLLHGFPEFWMGWEPAMSHLAAAGFRTIAPDQRGYNTSEKPEAVDDYKLDALEADIVDLINEIGGPVVLVGHDWGGGVAWAVAADHPDLISHLVIMNAPHMNVFKHQLETNPEQVAAFSYLDFFVMPGSEATLAANDFGILASMFEGVLSDDELAAYKTAWGQDRALEGGLNWYRANFEDGLPNVDRDLLVDVPTLVMWGMADTALLPSNLPGLADYVSDLEIIEVEDATHWINREEAELIAGNIETFVE